MPTTANSQPVNLPRHTLHRMTARLPFDPSRMRGSPPPQPAAADPAKPLSVSDLAARIAAALDTLPRSLRVIGEVSGFRDRTHWYFDLKDQDAVVNCVMFAAAARKSGLTLQNGQSVVATGRLDFYAKGGKVSFICETLEPVGAGALELAYRRLVEEIRALGWFDPARKRPLPTFPRRIAIITSRTGAALQDVIDTARRRCPAVELAVIDARVQGDRAAPEVASAITWVGQHHERLGIDALLITRGGGSMEDLWAFNEKIVAAAIVACPIPVVAAIGHETDTTIAELVADERAATPTQAAMRLIPDAGALLEQVDSLATRLRTGVSRHLLEERRRVESAGRHAGATARLAIAAARARVDRTAARLDQHRPAAAQARRQARLDQAHARLAAAMSSHLARHDLAILAQKLSASIAHGVRAHADALNAADRTLNAVSPLRVLARGYSVTTNAQGRVVRSTLDVALGDPLVTRLPDGLIRSTADGQSPPPRRPSPDHPSPTPPTPKPLRRPSTPGDPGLFG